MPDLVARLSGLYQTLTARLALQDSLLSLSGRLDMVISQIEMRSSAAPAPLPMPKKGKKSKAREESGASASASPTRTQSSDPISSTLMDRQTRVERMVNLRAVPSSPIVEETIDLKFLAEATLISRQPSFSRSSRILSFLTTSSSFKNGGGSSLPTRTSLI